MSIFQLVALGAVVFYGIALYALTKYGVRIVRNIFR